MGIEVPDFEFASTGVTLPLVYMALSRNMLNLDPRGPWQYRLFTHYNIWSSYEAREAGKTPVETRILDFLTPPQTTTLAEVYTLAYDQLKVLYPNYIDKQDPPDPTPEPAPEPTPEPAPTDP